MSARFKRTIEDFTCERCNMVVRGSGYTDHCHRCLWSKHVDVWPGDRAAHCSGLMEPIAATETRGRFVLYYRCCSCGALRRNRSSPEDSREVLVELSSLPVSFYSKTK